MKIIEKIKHTNFGQLPLSRMVLISISLHLIIAVLTLAIALFIPTKRTPRLHVPAMDVETVTLKELRTVGEKLGENIFQAPMQILRPPAPSLTDLSFAAKAAVEESGGKKDEVRAEEDTLPLSAPVFNSYSPEKEGEQAKNQMLGKMSQATPEYETLESADFSVRFDPPKGVKEDELNSFEKKFYSFQKRSYRVYITSFMRAYQKKRAEKPYIDKILDSIQFTLVARVTFDRLGNVVAIKMFRWAENDEVQNLFEETLKGMDKLPNPPADLFVKESLFSVFYQLRIN